MSLRVERSSNDTFVVHGTPDEIDGYGAHLEANGYYRRSQSKDGCGNVCKAVFRPGGRPKTDRYVRTMPGEELTAEEVARHCEMLAEDAAEDDLFEAV